MRVRAPARVFTLYAYDCWNEQVNLLALMIAPLNAIMGFITLMPRLMTNLRFSRFIVAVLHVVLSDLEIRWSVIRN